MREPGLGWTGLIVANSPGGDGVEEFEEGYWQDNGALSRTTRLENIQAPWFWVR